MTSEDTITIAEIMRSWGERLAQAPSDAERLAELRRQIAEGEAGIVNLGAALASRDVPRLHGDAEAERSARQLEQQRRELHGRLESLRRVTGETEARIRSAAAADRREAAMARPSRLAEMIAEFVERDRRLLDLFKQAAGEMRAQVLAATGLAHEIGGVAVARSFASTVWGHRFRSALAHHFHGDEFSPAGAAHSAANNLLNLESDMRGAGYWEEIDDLDQRLFDDICSVYRTEAEAKAALDRRAACNLAALAGLADAVLRREYRGIETPAVTAPTDGVDAIVARCGEAWTLIPHDRLFRSRVEAEAALRASSLLRDGFEIIEWAPGVAVVPAEFDEVIAPALPPAAAAAA